MTITDRYAPRKHQIPWPSDLAYDMALDFIASSSLPAAPAKPRRPRDIFVPDVLPTPILALDVDGPLFPFALRAPKRLRERGYRRIDGWERQVTYPKGSGWFPYSDLWLSRDHGGMLRAFSINHDVELVWASLWEHNANRVIAPALGLPRLDYVRFHEHPSRAWKWEAVAEYAAGRPLAWLDDSFGVPRKERQRVASSWAEARRGLPTLLHRVSPAVGLTKADLGVVASWLSTARLAWS